MQKSEHEAVETFSESMRKTLYESKREECIVEGCPAEVFRSGVQYCAFHWQQELEKREKERQKQINKNEKYMNSPKYDDDQRRNSYFIGHRHCEKCGKFCGFDEGKVRNRPGTKYTPGTGDNCYQTICMNCEKKGGE